MLNISLTATLTGVLRLQAIQTSGYAHINTYVDCMANTNTVALSRKQQSEFNSRFRGLEGANFLLGEITIDQDNGDATFVLWGNRVNKNLKRTLVISPRGQIVSSCTERVG